MTTGSAPCAVDGYQLCFPAVKQRWRTDEFWRVAPGENATVRQNVTRPPPRMRWRGPGQAMPYRFGGQLPGFSRHRVTSRQCQPPALSTGFPALLTSPESPPKWYPFPAVRYFYCFVKAPRKSARAFIFFFFAIHKMSTEIQRLSASTSGFPLLYAQLIHRLPDVIPGSP